MVHCVTKDLRAFAPRAAVEEALQASLPDVVREAS
jgi:hypothetical protein